MQGIFRHPSMKLRPFTGTITALVTPFKNQAVAYDDLRKLVEFQIKSGINGLVPVGTTGESPTLSHEEHLDVIHAVIETTRGRVPVIAGTGSNSTHEAVDLTTLATEAGADAVLVVAPYYNKPSQEGVFRYFCAVAEATDKPVILYSIPGRCGIEISVPVVERLRAKYPHVRYIKEAGGSVDRVDQLKQALGKDITVLSGDDSLTLPFMSVGAEGATWLGAATTLCQSYDSMTEGSHRNCSRSLDPAKLAPQIFADPPAKAAEPQRPLPRGPRRPRRSALPRSPSRNPLTRRSSSRPSRRRARSGGRSGAGCSPGPSGSR